MPRCWGCSGKISSGGPSVAAPAESDLQTEEVSDERGIFLEAGSALAFRVEKVRSEADEVALA